MIKVAGGQRSDLPALRKRDLPAIWADFNAAGMGVRKTAFVAKAATADEVMEMVAAFTQLCREGARYLHRV